MSATGADGGGEGGAAGAAARHGAGEAELCVVLCTAPEKDAARLARGLVDSRLCACVARVPGLVSVYRWQGQVEQADEVQLVIKTTRARFAAVRDWITANHPYDVPEVLCLPVLDASSPYAAWLRAEVDEP